LNYPPPLMPGQSSEILSECLKTLNTNQQH